MAEVGRARAGVGERRRRIQSATTGVVAAVVVLHGTLFALDLWPAPRLLWGDEQMYVDLARRVAAGQTARIDPLFPPGYVYFLAALFTLGGGSLLVVSVVQVLLLVAGALVFRDIGLRLTGSERAAAVAAALLLLDPQVAAFAHYYWPEILHLVLFLVGFWILVARSASTAWVALSGLAIGLALLTKSILGPFLPVLLWPFVAMLGMRRALGKVGVVLGIAAAIHVPTGVANYQSGDPLIADSSRFNLWVGLTDRTRRGVTEPVWDRYKEWQRSGATSAERTTVLNQRIRSLIEERGVWRLMAGQLSRQYFRLLDRDSLLTDQLPGGAIADQGRGYVAVPAALAAALRVWSYVLYAAVLVAAPLGFVLRPPRDRWLWVLLGFAAYQLGLFFFLHAKSRYRIPLLPVLYLGAGCCAEALRSRVHVSARFPIARWVGGGALATLSLVLGFGRELFE